MKIILLYIMSVSLLFGNDIDRLLRDIEVKDDLSMQTKKANNGIVTVYTRSDLNMMNAIHLRDILKSTEIGYKINRYGFVDPNTKGFSPFSSSGIRIYIDNQEISSSLYGSGLTVLGDIDLDFVDHIEIYTFNPSFEFTTEPTTAMIKLYSKNKERDPQTTVNYSYGSYESKNISLNTSNNLGEYAYFFHISKDNDNKKRSFIDNQELSRDTSRKHSFLSLYNKERKIIISSIKVNKDSFMGMDWEADTSKSDMKIDTLHIGYDEKFENDISFQINYDSMIDNSVFENNNILFLYNNIPIQKFEVNGDSKVLTTKIHKKQNISNHSLLYGLKYRYKDLKYDSIKLNGSSLLYKGITKQKINTYFIEDNYNLRDNSIVAVAVQYSKVNNDNHNNIKDDKYALMRLGNTYIDNNIMYQTFLYYQELFIEPYLVNSIYLENDNIEKEQRTSFLEKITYKNKYRVFDITYTHDRIKNYITTSPLGYIKNSLLGANRNSLLFRLTHNHSDINKHYISYYINHIKDNDTNEKDISHKIVFKNFSRYNKWDFFEELIIDKVDEKLYYDLSLSANYEYSNNLRINIKIENLLNKAEKQYFIRNSTTVLEPLDPYQLSTIDRKVILTLGYSF